MFEHEILSALEAGAAETKGNLEQLEKRRRIQRFEGGLACCREKLEIAEGVCEER